MRLRIARGEVLGGVWLLAMLFTSALGAQTPARVRQETIRIAGPLAGLKLGLRHVAPNEPSARRDRPVVLILLGAAVPVSGNADYPFGGRSMMTALAEEGFDVWAMDYYGYGESDRYPEMDEPADRHPPLGPVEEVVGQVDSAVAFLRRATRVDRIILLGDSRGTMVAGRFAAFRPELVSRLILFGPVTPVASAGPAPAAALPAYVDVTPSELWTQFATLGVPPGEAAVLDSAGYTEWAARYLRSDPRSGTRSPASVRIPNGWSADVARVASGRFVYDPSQIRAPTLIVMGEWDVIASFEGAERLLKSLRQARHRRLVVIGRGTHTIQFETERSELYRVLADFMREEEHGATNHGGGARQP